MLLYRPMVLPSRLLRRGAGGTLKSTRSAAGDIICTFMPFFLLLVEARRTCKGLLESLSVSHGTEHSWRGHQRQEAVLGVYSRTCYALWSADIRYPSVMVMPAYAG